MSETLIIKGAHGVLKRDVTLRKKMLHDVRWILLQQGEKPQRVPEKWGVVVQYHSLSQNTALN